jgi:hypothetical protein
MTGGCRSKVAGGLDGMGPPDFDGVVGDPFVEAAQHGSHRDGWSAMRSTTARLAGR